MVHLDYRDARPIYTQIIEGLQKKITAGVLEPGDKLPSVRELAGQLAINPNTIQRAYRELELMGWIATVPGKGFFVCDIPKGEDISFDAFDEMVEKLLSRGVTRQQLLERLEKGGNDNA